MAHNNLKEILLFWQISNSVKIRKCYTVIQIYTPTSNQNLDMNKRLFMSNFGFKLECRSGWRWFSSLTWPVTHTVDNYGTIKQDLLKRGFHSLNLPYWALVLSFLSIAPLSVDDHLVILYTNTNPNGHFVHKYQPERSFCTQILTRFDTLRRGEVWRTISVIFFCLSGHQWPIIIWGMGLPNSDQMEWI